MSSEDDLISTPNWDPKWSVLARQYKQHICTDCSVSLDANTGLLQKQLDRLAHMYEDKDKDSNQGMYMAFVDDLLLGGCKQPSSEGNGLEGTVLGNMDPFCVCLAALFFLS